MPVCPAVITSSLGCALTAFRDVFVYIKHRRRRVRDLSKDFEDLKVKLEDLLARWKDINDEIDQDERIEKNEQYTTMEKKVSRKNEEFEKIEELYTKLCTDLESRVGAASGSNAGTDGHYRSGLSCCLLAVRLAQIPNRHRFSNSAANNNQRSQEAENGSQTNARGAANENQAGIGKQKIWTRNFFKIGRLDKDVVKLISEVTELKKELERGGFTRQKQPKSVERMEAEELGDIVPSHQKHLDDLLEYVNQKKYKRIGIYGAPGVGVTNILKKLNNCFFDEPRSFNGNLNVDYVIWVTVSKENNNEKLIQTIQEEIMERLSIIGGNTRNQNRNAISGFLSAKKYLLLLDDFSRLVKLEDVGIQKEHEHGKVVMAAKNSQALINAELDEWIKVKSLSNRDAQKLFKHFIKDYDDLLPKQKDMVYEILKPLGGLPESIKLTARYLNNNRKLEDWEGAKVESQSDYPCFLEIAPLIDAYKKEYENLAQNYLKKCLLYAALFPSGHKIRRSTLVECWKAENFLNCPTRTLNDARAVGTVVVNRLRDTCLLKSCDERFVKMSVFFRKLAFQLSFPEESGKLYAKSGSDEKGHESWNNATRVSLIRNNLGSEPLPISPQRKDISTLLLQHNPRLELIKDGFFINMKGLRVLDLHGTGIASLPHSISNMIALRSLYLNDCGKLNKLPKTIKKLKELEVLDIRGTSIPCLPSEILSIVSLRCLRISFATENCNLATGSKLSYPNPPWVIFLPDAHTRLSNLEEITIHLIGEVSHQVCDIIIEEAALFRSLKLNFEPGQSFGTYSQASKDKTGELSNFVEEPSRSPSNVDERPAGSAPSSATVQQSNNNQISDGENITSQSHSHGQNDSSDSSCCGTPRVTSSRVNKGKEVEKLLDPRKTQIHHDKGIKIKDTPMANTPSDSDDETDGSVADQLQKDLGNADRRIDTSAGEGTSAAH